MTNISKRPLNPKHLQKLFEQMDTIIVKLSPKAASIFLNELLGYEERIMLAKRFAAIMMCIEKHSGYRIAKTLKISFSTAERIRNAYRVGKYLKIESIVKKNTHSVSEFFRTLEVVLRAGLPPRVGKNRAHLWFKKLPR